ncbi:Helix-turn-helix domain-containing protein [Tissierella praeacuta DSM 18095]|uniref:Helix-turn-helix domain-containing protein n=1 Tax=Tissierella praeacuta DSM 18095 TaxID=1123404 RepID=A0A1M4UBN3_9FIRM|nr:helix-turn-helix transcriptional regulator [Tissierella praeacuta]SHE54202.1 Helix-turn-helix domain-containing protein [Tissierella praeacuta DSM 18095]SUP04023.1 HTH-type transcriptional regulator immR [Tissierella praeacuta]
MDLSNIGKRIQNRREELGMKQEELAERVSLSPNYMSAIERGVKIPRLETFIRIANALEVSTDILLEDVLVKGNEIKASNLWEEINHLPSKEQERILRVIEVMVEMETND